uniref:NnrU domain-containing protein n=1 Tax=Araucaria cunninghamii TaxID=56994 RepID=A0A0D6R5V5_ARACU
MASTLLAAPLGNLSAAKYRAYLSTPQNFRQIIKSKRLKFAQTQGKPSLQRRLSCRARASPEKPGFESECGLVSPNANNAGSSSAGVTDDGLVGEDAAFFDVASQKVSSWTYFTLILGAVLAVLYVAWIDPTTGYGDDFVNAVSSLSDSQEVVLLLLLFIFAGVHSGMASFRDAGERLIGERAYRVLFAGLSLPLAFSAVVYFINHRYDGVQLWQVQSIPGVHQLVWLSSFVSFFFLYPSTFNLLEVAAVDKPKMHIWETGIMRITRHPQMVGQFVWCAAHTLWMGNSMVLTASLGLIAHHIFGVWNGDRRMSARYGEAFEIVKNRTSVIPFAAILDGRQKLPKDYYKEFLRVPYLTILMLTLGIYLAHPLMQGASYDLHW